MEGNPHRLPWVIAILSLTFALVLLVLMIARDRQGRGAGIGQTAAQGNVAAAAVTPAGVAVGAGINAPVQPATPAATQAAAVSTLAITPAPTVAGSMINGTVIDEQGKPVPNATIKMTVEGQGVKSQLELSAGQDGRFEAKNLAGNKLSALVAEAPGFAPSDPIPALDLPITDLEIAIRRESGAEIQVLAAREDGQPTPYSGEATVFVYRVTAGTAGGAPSSSLVSEQKVTIRDGKHTLKALETGTYRVGVAAGEEYAEGEDFQAGDATVQGGQVVLGLQQYLTGTVASDPEKQPIPGARLALEPVSCPPSLGPSRPHQVQANEAGQFELSGIALGTYRLTIAADGFLTKTLESISVPGGAPPDPAKFFLPRAQPGITVRVVDEEDQPVEKAPLSLVPVAVTGRMRPAFGDTDAQGNCRFTPVLPGRYTVTATMPLKYGRQQKAVEVNVAPGEDATASISFAKPIRVAGRAYRKGKPYEGRLTFSPRGQLSIKSSSRADVEGTFVVDLEPGEYMVGDPKAEERAVLKVSRGATEAVELAIP